MVYTYRIQRRVTVAGKPQHIRAVSEQEYVDKITALVMESLQQTEHKVNFKHYVRRWYEVHAKPTVEEVTQITYTHIIDKYIIPSLGDYSVDEITTGAVQEMVNRMDGLKRATKSKVVRLLSQILDYAVDDGLIAKNPAKSKKLKVTGGKSTPRQPYTLEQMQWIVQHLEDIKADLDRAYITLLALHPLRPEEALGLMWSDIDFGADTLSIQRAVTHPNRNQPIVKDTKTSGSTRVIGLSLRAREVLLPLQGPGYVVGWESGPLTYQQVKRLCGRVRLDLDFDEPITASRFRPTVISDIYDKTGDLKLVQELAGHADVDVTLRHYISTRKTMREGVDAVDELYAQKMHNNTNAQKL